MHKHVHMFNVWITIKQFEDIKEWKLLRVTDYTNQTPSKHFTEKETQNENKNHEMCIK